MGLFGYNEKDFERNSARFQQQIDAIRELMLERGGEYHGVGKNLDEAARKLGSMPYPGKNLAKSTEAVDQRIEGLLQTLMNDLQEGRSEYVKIHSKMLKDAVNTSRRFGKEQKSKEELDAEENIGATYAEMEECSRELDEINARMKKIEEQSDFLSEDDPAFKRLDREYGLLEQQKASVNRKYQVCYKRYEADRRIVNMRSEKEIYKKLPEKLVSQKDLEREIAEANMAAEAEDAYISDTTSSLDEFERGRESALGRTSAGGASSSLTARKRMKESESLTSDIENSDWSGDYGEAPSSSLRNRKRNN